MKSPRDNTTTENHEDDPMMLPLLEPFPDLPFCVAPPMTTVTLENHPKKNTKTTKKRLRHHDDNHAAMSRSMPLQRLPSATRSTTSTPISLPTSHIRRTTSELRLEALTIRAEDQDVKMYSRLLSGMQHQIQNRYCASGGDGGHDEDAHPLSIKSIHGIMTTKLANDRDLETQYAHQELRDRNDDGHNADDDADDGGGWDLSYSHIAEENENGSSLVEAPPPSKELKDSLPKLRNDDTDGQEDDFVFSLEL
mmetsp:Transcript_31167/g.57034  ORF Transcript_31167/g.57034 Transcript_31167/m.57034 type:complete len:251 (+) Transcript_31167:1-753(+)|eukprot:CAMPEP_0201617074 /NCGR_PEP_ID=MMETSP0492-20130828/35406_1 /ASSEMBLY_ACC=CAM_ASM_000837 /TAXON_ID=420259 /ORGANISM="Thalassiosira gravida, Strain GMp14c1" /LENGTH=250 /DNA_ID=CAMNT_0048085203 /DNA_START=72 /DNA_END=824 /DNA_ORIENTATION=-